jgi:hypothetical protein
MRQTGAVTLRRRFAMGPSLSSIEELVGRFEASDQRVVREAGDRLVELGTASVPALIRALESGEAPTRRAAAFLLGRLPASRASIEALLLALRDSEPKVRKNAAVSLGAIGEGDAVTPLIDALGVETVPWVRPSLVLALGQLGGERVHQVLERTEALSSAEAEALRKAKDRAVKRPAVASWKPLPERPGRVHALVPTGLEDVAAAEAAEQGFAVLPANQRGVLAFGEGTHPEELQMRLRCLEVPCFLVGAASGARQHVAEMIPRDLDRILARPGFLARWRDWIASPSEPLGYRFALTGQRVPKKVFNEALSLAKERLRPLGLEDRPSNYALEVRADVTDRGTNVWAIPRFHKDARFAYRVSDVGASVQPVVAACLARLVRAPGSKVVLDPTCGSATLLVERALLDEHAVMVGLDVSPTAVRAAEQNIVAAGLGKRVMVRRADAAVAANWPDCDEAIMNLPFGLRTAKQDEDLAALYAGIVRALSHRLRPGGRALLYTANRRLLAPLLARSSLSVWEERIVRAGGLAVGLWVVTASPSKAARHQ